MKLHKVVLYVIDHDMIGPENVKGVLENTEYTNRCIRPEVGDIQTFDIGPWHDDHPLNYRGCDFEAFVAGEKTEKTSDWYDCAHCEAGYPDQECTCEGFVKGEE